MSLEFLAPGAAFADRGSEPIARSPMERGAKEAGARFEVRHGWNVAVAYPSQDREREACRSSVGWVDSSHLGKIEIQAQSGDLAAIVRQCTEAELAPGMAVRDADAWWCPVTPERVMVLCEPDVLPAVRDAIEDAAGGASEPSSVVEITTVLAALTIVGPQARETFARFCALDLRAKVTPLCAFRPGSVARTPGMVLREGEERFLMLFGWALGQYMWTVVSDAATALGGGPVGVDALSAEVPRAVEEARRA